MAFAACGPGSTVRDWGLHLQWTVERDCNHPERPARLVEVPWTAAGVAVHVASGTASDDAKKTSPRTASAPKAAQAAPEVRAGMRVTLCRQDENSAVRLSGTAMRTARTGETIPVRAGWRGTVLQGIVRGPSLVELLP
jgi:hypothetical protein